jgi:hypothetical protein
MDEKNYSETQNLKKYRIIKPSFYVDDERRVICESHSQIERIRVLSSLAHLPAFGESQQVEKILTCKTCKHYQNDECYFPKEEIDRIEKDRLSYTFHCKLCGGSIDRPLTIMYSLYNKEKFQVDIPLVCCTCFSTLDDDSFMTSTRRRIIFFTLSFLASIFLFLSYSMVLFSNPVWGIILMIVALVFWGYMAVRDVRSIIFLIRGRKYYKKTYGKAKERKDGKYIDDYPFD